MATEASYRDPDWLEQRYHDDGCTQADIADECGVSVRTVRRYMNRFEIETRDPVGEDHPLYGTARSEGAKTKISETMKGREFSEETREKLAAAKRGGEIPVEVREKISESLEGIERPPETRQKMSDAQRGENNPRWKGGVSNNYGPGWRPARRRIRARDEVCQGCGHDGSEMKLHVHHIIPFRVFKQSDEFTAEDAHFDQNLVLLCQDCHVKAERGELADYTPITEISSMELERFKKGESLVSDAFE